MTTTNKKLSLRDQIANQAASTAEDLYAKRNAFLAASNEEHKIIDGQFKLTGQEEVPILQTDQTEAALKLTTNPPQGGQPELTSQLELTTNPPQSGQLELTSQLKLTTETIQIVRTVGLSGTGALALFAMLTNPDGAYIRTRHLARELNMTYQGLLNQIEKLTDAGYLESTAGDPALGKWIRVTPPGQFKLTSQFELTSQLELTGQKNLTLRSSSSSSIINTTTTTTTTTTTGNSGQLELTSQLELTTPLSLGEVDFTDQEKMPDHKFAALPPWERESFRSRAEELFYVSLAANFEPAKLSMQALTLYKKLSEERSKEYAAALFLILLPKATDNPVGYVVAAVKRGAEATPESVTKMKELRESLTALDKRVDIKDLKQQMQEALDAGNIGKLTSLTEFNSRVKKALCFLSWKGTLEELIQKRDDFVKSLLGLP
jgi:DNA-binding MarR family transcriptional regulator